MNCKYSYYKEEEKYCPLLYCKVEENSRCMFSKKCLIVDKYIQLEGDVWKECPRYNMQMQKEIPNGANFIQTYREDKRGNIILYVVINDKVEKVNTKLKEINQDYIYIRDGLDGYEVSLVPFSKTTVSNKEIVEVDFEDLIKTEEPKQEKKKSYKRKVGLTNEKEKEYKSR